MATYLVRLIGHNFLIDGDRGPTRKRFHSTRLVDAPNAKQAEAIARNAVRKYIDFQESVLNADSDPPMISLESLNRVNAIAYDVQNRAHSFYWDDEGS